ncbi:AAA family ATPase [Chitinivorax sp. B]|uniref:AAA family ATPase n=1 Tax=Chitinivorax sp. B TaxID=2502235 RepID=UPI002017AD63|nr:AAA family ATPase [Chitinivorax sp. B]
MLTDAHLASLKTPQRLICAPYSILQQLVPTGVSSPDWPQLLEVIPPLKRLATTPQDPRYHAEGNVWTHTQMVLEALLAHAEYQSTTPERQFVLFYAALLHDVAKPATTTVDRLTGAIGQPGHSSRGAVDTRILLWRSGVPFALREAICRLIAVHQIPFYALKGSRSGHSPEFLVRKLSHELMISELALLAEADMRGRICTDQAETLVNIELFRELAREEQCYDQPRAFADVWTRQRYFNGGDVHPDYVYHRDAGSQVIVLCGLPASGKDSWVRKYYPDLPVVSFDDARTSLGLKHGENDGQAAHWATDLAKTHLRTQRPFVWNATHLSRQMRAKTLDLLFAYGATVKVVYLEQPPAVLFERNRKRDTSLSNAGIERMLYRWEVVLPTEAHEVRYDVSSM